MMNQEKIARNQLKMAITEDDGFLVFTEDYNGLNEHNLRFLV